MKMTTNEIIDRLTPLGYAEPEMTAIMSSFKGYSSTEVAAILTYFPDASSCVGFDGDDTCAWNDNVCTGWDGYSRRCECGNRRVSWEVDFKYARAVAY
jgi:hypothetical protein